MPFAYFPTALPGARRERCKQARPGELLDAALDLFVEKGFTTTQVEAVAAKAGVSKGTLFLYFPSKDDLFKAVVRENISGRFAEWNRDFAAFTGSTCDMLTYCLTSWWELVGLTRASGIAKLVMSKAANFPQIAAFYQQEVIEPGYSLVRRTIQRGIDRGEFRPMDTDHAIFSIFAPMLFMALTRYAEGACLPPSLALEPQRYIAFQLDIMPNGLQLPVLPMERAPA